MTKASASASNLKRVKASASASKIEKASASASGHPGFGPCLPQGKRTNKKKQKNEQEKTCIPRVLKLCLLNITTKMDGN